MKIIELDINKEYYMIDITRHLIKRLEFLAENKANSYVFMRDKTTDQPVRYHEKDLAELYTDEKEAWRALIKFYETQIKNIKNICLKD